MIILLRGDMFWKLEINSFRGVEIGTLSQSRLFAAAFGEAFRALITMVGMKSA